MAKVKVITDPVKTGKYIYSIGTVEFDEKGIAEVEEDSLDELLESDSRLSFLEKGDEEKIQKEEQQKKELESLGKADLIELVKESGLDEKEASKMKKDALVEYLMQKLNKTENTQE